MNRLKLFKITIPVLAIALMLGLSSFTTNGSEVKLPNISYSVSINKSADKVWKTLRQLDGLEKIAPQIFTHTSINTREPKVGCVRTCIAQDKSKWVETIVEFSDETRFFKYQLDEGPVPAKNMVNTLRVIDLGYNKCLFVWTSTFDFLKNPNVTEKKFKELMLGSIAQISEGLTKKIK